jgi:hypothetical protein
MKDAFGRDDFVHYDDVSWSWCCDYNIVAFDLEREVLFLFEYKMQKLFHTTSLLGNLIVSKMAISGISTMCRGTQRFQAQILIFEDIMYRKGWLCVQ